MSAKELIDERYELGSDETPSEGVYTAVAVVEECSPVDIPPIASVIDPEALDAFLTGRSGTDTVSFPYCRYQVTVSADEVRLLDVQET